jgi:hypothetical protein
MLEPYASKGACPVLRGGGGGNATSLPDQQTAGHDGFLGLNGSPTPPLLNLSFG